MLSSDNQHTEDLADLYDNAPCGYVSLSPRGKIVKVNQTLASWLGRQPDDMLGHPIHEIFGFGAKLAYETHLAPLLRMQGFVYEVALELVDGDEQKFPIIVNAAEKRGDDGEHLFTRLTMFKATDRAKFERNLIEAKAKAEAKSALLGQETQLREQFIAVLGHDLRNPLAAIEAGIHMLERNDQLSQRERIVTREINSCITRATDLIEDVMDFARGKLGGGLPLDIDMDQRIEPVLEQVVRRNAGNFSRSHLQLRHRCEPVGRL